MDIRSCVHTVPKRKKKKHNGLQSDKLIFKDKDIGVLQKAREVFLKIDIIRFFSWFTAIFSVLADLQA